jgi:hypothetical protein
MLAALSPVEISKDFQKLQEPLSAYEYFDSNISERPYISPVESSINIETSFKIKSFEFLNENWDNYGAARPYEETVQNSLRFLKDLPKKYLQKINQDSISLTPYGTIVIDWEDNTKNISVEIGINSLGFFANINKENLSSKEIKIKHNEIPLELAEAFRKFYS